MEPQADDFLSIMHHASSSCMMVVPAMHDIQGVALHTNGPRFIWNDKKQLETTFNWKQSSNGFFDSLVVLHTARAPHELEDVLLRAGCLPDAHLHRAHH